MNAIQKALDQFKIPNAWWPVPLVNQMLQIDISLVIPWVSDCFLDTVAHEEHPRGKLLVELSRKAVVSTSIVEIEHMLDEYDQKLHVSMDHILLSYRNLVQAMKFQLENDLVGFRTQVVWLLLHLGECKYCKLSNIKFILDRFSEVTSCRAASDS